MLRLCSLTLLCVALAGCSAARGGIPQPTPERPLRGLDQYIQQAVEDWGIAGLAIAVVERDSVVFAKGYGVRDVRTGEPVDEHTIFAIGSNTKLFTAAAAGMLVDEERMDWNDPATEHLPGFQLYDPYVTREITIRDLLSHRSGLGRRGDLLWYGSGLTSKEILNRVRYLEPNTSFRSQFGYQNIMFLAAGQAVGNAAGMTWDEFIARRIFDPLGMERSTTSTLPLERMDNVAQPHEHRDGKLIPVPYRNIDNVAPAGSINSTAADMAQWLRLMLGEGTYEGRELIDSATVAEIMSPQTILPMQPDTLFPSTHFSAYGLGIGLQDYRSAKLARHTGGIDGMYSLVGMLPEQDVGIVILTNTSGNNNVFAAVMYRVFDAYLGAPARDWSRIFLQQAEQNAARAAERRREMEASRVPGTRPSLERARYAGTYRDELYGDVKVSLDGEGLALHFGPFIGDLEHWHYNTFRVNWREGAGLAGQELSFVTFELGARGEPRALEIPGLEEDFERVETQPATAGAR